MAGDGSREIMFSRFNDRSLFFPQSFHHLSGLIIKTHLQLSDEHRVSELVLIHWPDPALDDVGTHGRLIRARGTCVGHSLSCVG